MSAGRPPTLWWLLITCALPVLLPADSITSGIDRALRQPFRIGQLARFLVEDLDEQVADDLALGFRVGDAFQRLEVAIGGVDADDLDAHAALVGSLANIAITWSPSFQRSRPVSTNTQVSWSPIALCSSAATTDESTPPDRPRITSSLPTCSRTRAIWSSMMWAAVHSVWQPQMSMTKRRSSAWPDLVWVTSGWNCTPYQRLSSLAIAATGMRSVRAVTMKPGGATETWSPWLIHTSRRGGEPGVVLQAVEQRILRDQLDLRVAELARVGGLGGAAQLRGQGLHAVADAQDRQAGVEHLLRRLGRAGERGRFRAARQDDALGAELRDLGRIVVPGPDLAIHADLADAARDQLRVLRAEVEDQDLVGMDVGRYGMLGQCVEFVRLSETKKGQLASPFRRPHHPAR